MHKRIRVEVDESFLKPSQARELKGLKSDPRGQGERLEDYAKIFWDAHRKQPRRETFVLHRCCLSRSNFEFKDNREFRAKVDKALADGRRIIHVAGPRLILPEEADLSGWNDEVRIWRRWMKLKNFELYYRKQRLPYQISVLGNYATLIDYEPFTAAEKHWEWKWVKSRTAPLKDRRRIHWMSKSEEIQESKLVARCLPDDELGSNSQALGLRDYVAFNIGLLTAMEKWLWEDWELFFGHLLDEEALLALPDQWIKPYLDWRCRQSADQRIDQIKRRHNSDLMRTIQWEEILNNAALREKSWQLPWRWAETQQGKWAVIHRGRIDRAFRNRRDMDGYVKTRVAKLTGDILLHHFPKKS